MTTPKVQYSYANGSGNQIRPMRMTYPDGRELNLDYGSAGSQADLLSRVAALIDDDGSTHLADSSYLGLGTPVITDYTQPDVRYTLVGTAGGNDPDTGDIYRGLDRFGRVKDAYWRDYGANTDAARIQYGYDRASNRTYRADPVAVANSAEYEELYAYDGLQRLAQMQRGTLNGGHTALTAKSFAQCWTLDPTGNWKGFREDSNGDSAWDLIQARTSNPVNEITNISNSVGSAWANPVYNASGNMTTIPKPADPTQSYTATYDAWNRLVKLSDGADTVAEYQYDARNYRTVEKSYSGGVLDETRHIYYTNQWQDIEERLGTSPDSADAERQFVWGRRYIDDLVLRDRDTNGDGTLDERLYALQDGNWNVIALTDTAGDVQERYAYQAYGTPKFLTSAFGNRASSSFEWETLYAGYRFDVSAGLYAVRNRHYHPKLGYWTTRDPIGYLGDINLYNYCHNTALSTVDSFGLRAWHYLLPKFPYERVGSDLRKALLSACESCDNANGEQAKCRQDAEAFASSIQSTVKRNFWWWWEAWAGGDEDENNTVGGYLCYEWAFAFHDVFSDSISDSPYFEATVEEATHRADLFVPSARVHYWLKIHTTCGDKKDVYLDDGFDRPGSSWVTEHRPIPDKYILTATDAARPKGCQKLVCISRKPSK